MSYQLPFFPDRATAEIIPGAVLKLLVGRTSNEHGAKSLDVAIGIFRDLGKSKTADTRIKITLSELFAMASVDQDGTPLLDKDGNPVRVELTQDDIAAIHSAAAAETYVRLKAAFERAGVPSIFEGAVEV